MRVTIYLVATVILASTSVGMAGDNSAMNQLLPETSEAECYGRVYDGDHLGRHPDQTVRSMLFMIEHRNGLPTDDSYAYDGKLRVTVRGMEEPFWQGLECGWRHGRQTDKRSFECGVECDGGSFQLTGSRRSGSLLLTLDRLSLSEGCGLDEETGEGYELLPGIDDRLFRLDPLPVSNCKRAFRPMELAEISGAIKYEGRTISDAFCKNPRIVEYVLSEANSGSKETRLISSRYRPNVIHFQYAQTKGGLASHYCAYSFTAGNTFDFGTYAVFFDFDHDPPTLKFRELDGSVCVGC